MRFTHRPTTTPLLARYCRQTLRRDSPRRRHICAATGRTAATSVPGLCFEWPSSHFRRAYTVLSHLFASRKPSAVIFTTRIDASGPSVTPSSPNIAAITVLRFDWDKCPTVLIGLSVRAVRALHHLFVIGCSSPRMNVRPWDEFTHGTRAANLAYLAFVLPQSTYATFYQDAFSCRARASAVGNQSAPLAAPACRVPKKPKKRPMGQADWMRFQKPRYRAAVRTTTQSSPDFQDRISHLSRSIRH
jgi:hypothetical protein